jgi:hypothetical protein
MKELNIENVGPIESLSIPIPEGGGVVVLRGRNGSGKSTALEAARATLNKGESLTARDHAAKGIIEGFGARITIGRSTRRKGEAEIEHLEGRLSIADLVDPGLKSEEAADNARIKALASLQAASVDRSEWIRLAPEATETPLAGEELGGDIVTQASRVRRIYHAHALQIEKNAKAKLAKANASLDELESVAGRDMPNTSALAEQFAADRGTVQKLRSDLETYEQAQRRRTAASLRLSELGDVPQIDELDDAAKAAQVDLDAAVAKVHEAEELLAAARGEVVRRKANLAIAQDRRDSAKHTAEEVSMLKNTIDEIDKVNHVTAKDVEVAEQQAELSQAAHDSGVVVREKLLRMIAAQAEADEARKDIEHADLWREAARATDDILAKSIKVGQLKIVSGRLMARHARGLVPYSELSDGERWTIAIDIAADNMTKEDGIIVIDQVGWEGIDPINRRHIAAECKRRNIVILTAESDEGELRTEGGEV